jgi:hypothetical protein
MLGVPPDGTDSGMLGASDGLKRVAVRFQTSLVRSRSGGHFLDCASQ